MKKIIWIPILPLLLFSMNERLKGQVTEDFDVVFGQMAGDAATPLEGWVGALQSSDFGPTGIFPGLDSACGFFDAESGEPGAYVAMNYNNARFQSTDVTSTWLMSPEITLADRTVISFYTRTVELSPFPDRLVVRMSDNGDSIDVGKGALSVGDFRSTLIDINSNYELGGYPEQWTKYEIELKGTGDVTGRIAFHYFNEFMNVNGNYIGIDTFRHLPFLLGDINCDGFVNLLDIDSFLDAILSGVFNEKADLNSDGEVDLLDIDPFVDAIVGE